ncbi:hypothetical protein ACPCA8_08365 [Streptomyces capoamus]|uniref:hypothetical protein n=1 Tax=Streptomyces capoamus TaxID=68183 RepID=UPI003C2AAE8B
MARSDNRSDTELGCAVLLGLVLVGAVCWLVYQAVLWVVAEWRWAWFAGYAVAVPGAAYAIVCAWREERPFVPSRQLEAWTTAVATALAAAAPLVVLLKGWPTAIVALLVAAGSAAAVAYVPWWDDYARTTATVGPGRRPAAEDRVPAAEAGDPLPVVAAYEAE